MGMMPATLGLAYSLLTWDQPHRAFMAAVCVVCFMPWAAMLAVARRLVTSRWRRPAMFGSMLVHLACTSAATAADGGVTSPIAISVFGPLLYGATAIPTRLLPWLAMPTLASYAAIAVWAGAAPIAYVACCTAAVLAVTVISAVQARTMARQRIALRSISRTDPLTGCLNRRGFDERLNAELALARKTGDPVTLMLFDLDRFKEVNDTHGHAAGDALLCWSAGMIRTCVRTHDAVGRIGGDEFAALLTGADARRAPVVAGRIEAAVAERTPTSIGIASTDETVTTADDLYRRADEHLYRHKSRRRGAAAAALALDPAGIEERAALAPAAVPDDRQERRRRMITGGGALTITGHFAALAYALATPAADHRPAMIAIAVLGALLGGAMVLGARRLATGPHRRALVAMAALVNVLATAALVSLDGGAASPLVFGFLSPLAYVTISMPPRAVAVLSPTLIAVYVAIGLLGEPSRPGTVVVFAISLLTIALGCHGQAGLAARQRAFLARTSRVDALTGCLNRRGFEERLGAELADAHRTGRWLTLLLLDLDGFKAVNDTLGHAAGDELLRWTAGQLALELEAHDAVGRLGGDEFAVLLAGTPEEAERQIAALAQRDLASTGVARLPLDGSTAQALHRHADRALYAEKARRGADGRRRAA